MVMTLRLLFGFFGGGGGWLQSNVHGKFTSIHLYTLVEKATAQVKCLEGEQKLMSQGSKQTGTIES